MEAQWAVVVAAILVLVGAADTYAAKFGPVQTQINEAVIQAFQVASRYRPVLNYGLSVAVASTFLTLIAASVGTWEIVPAAVVVGALAAGTAADVHDTQRLLGTTSLRSSSGEKQQAGTIPPTDLTT